MLLGAHMSIAGGLNEAVDLLVEAGGNTLQIFTGSPGQWSRRKISDEEAESFKSYCQENGIHPILVHAPYLLNLATSDEKLRQRSIKALRREVETAELLGAFCVIVHMGAHRGIGEEEGLKNLSKSLGQVLENTDKSEVLLLLESTSGQGTQLGYRFEHIRDVIRDCRYHPRIGVCLDTCHLFTSGYDISTRQGYIKTFEEFKSLISWDRLKAIHVNDSKKHYGSRIDRHQHIGKGHIGLDGFSFIMNDPRLKDIPFILETPKEDEMDRVNIQTLKDLIK